MSQTYDSHIVDLQAQADQNTSNISALAPADNSFESKAFTTTTITIAGGMRKSGESYFNTYDGASTYNIDIVYTPAGLVLNETYFLFVDMDTSTPATRPDGAQVEQVVSANLYHDVLFNPDPAKYMRIGVFKTDGFVDITSASSLIPIVDGGASSIEAQTDTNITTPSNGQVMTWNNTSGKWENTTLTAVGETNTASNAVGGTGTGLVFKTKSGVDLVFRKIIGGTNVTVTNGTDDITIDSTDTGEVNTASMTTGGTGAGNVFKTKTASDLIFKKILGGTNVTITDGVDDITIDAPDTGEVNTASMAAGGTGVGLIFKTKTASDLIFKKILGGTNVTITNGADDITIDAPDTGEVNTASNSSSGTGTGLVFKGKVSSDLVFKKIIGGTNVTVTDGTDDITIDSVDTGEANTASHAVSGTGLGLIFKTKTASDLIFKKIKAGTNITVSDGTDDITLNVPALGETNTASNSSSGTGTGLIFKGKVSSDLVFKKIIGGTNVTVTDGTDDITIDGAAAGETNTASMTTGGTGLGLIFKTKTASDLIFKKILGGTNVTITNGVDDITIDSVGGTITEETVSAANALSGQIDNDILYVVETETFYRYEATSLSSQTADELFYLTVTSDANARWFGVAGKYQADPLSQDSQIVTSTSVSTATTGTFVTGHGGSTPIMSVKFWDNSAGQFEELSPASYNLDINEVGNEVTYDFTSVTFAASDYVELKAIYFGLATTASNEFTSDWVVVSAINDTKEGISATGYHEFDLPTGFITDPAGYSLLVSNSAGTTRYPGDVNSRMTFNNDGAQFRIAIETTTLDSTDKFRVVASKSARPTGSPLDLLVEEKYVGTVGRSDYPDLSSAAAKTLVTADLDSTSQAYGWNFSETSAVASAGPIADFAGGHDLTKQGTGDLALANDAEGNSRACDFDGTNDYCNNTSTDFNFTGDFSFSLWAYRADWSVTVTEVLISRRATGGWLFYLNGGGNFIFGTDDTSSTSAQTDKHLYTGLSAGWHQFTYTRQEGVLHSLYIDGELAETGLHATTDSITAAGSLEVGSNNGGASKFAGRIDEVVIQPLLVWDQAQVSRLYRSSTLSSHHGGVGHTLTATSFDRTISSNNISFYNLEADANDDSTNTNNLTDSTGSSVVYTGTNFDGTTGACVFDGSVDALYYSGTNLDDEGSFTVGCFMNVDANATGSVYPMGKYETAANAGRDFLVYKTVSTDTFGFQVHYDNANGNEFVEISRVLSGFVYFVCRYSQPNKRLDIFLNGELVKSETFTTMGTRNNGTGGKLTIGAYDGALATPNGFFKGIISNAFYTKYALTDEEITKLYSKKFAHHQSSGVYDLNMPTKVTKETGLIQKGNGEDFERSTDTTDVYADLSGLDASDKVQVKLK